MPVTAVAALPSIAANNDAVRLLQEAMAQAARIVADAHTQAKGILAEALQERESTRLERAQIVQERESILADASRAESRETLAEAGDISTGNVLQMSTPNGRGSVAIFFQGELAAATEGFSAACRIRAGGFGHVYKVAPHRLSGLGSDSTFVAVKRLNVDSMQGHAEFLQEVQVLGACRHVNVLALIGFSADRSNTKEDDGVCLVTPLMKGVSLEDRLLLNPEALRRLDQMPGAPPTGWAPLTWQQRLMALLGVLAGLDYLHTPDPTTHKPQILHRDIKPSNIFLDADGQARLGDLGLARQQRHITDKEATMRSIAGTNGFIDEYYQATGRFDTAADGYAMGITILATLTGWEAVDEVRGKLDARCEVDSDAQVVLIADGQADWPQELAIAVHRVGMALVKRNRQRRMTVREAKERIQTLVDRHLPPAAPEHRIVERECILCMARPRHIRFAWCDMSHSCVVWHTSFVHLH